MYRKPRSIELLVREAFGLVIKLRALPEALGLLREANAFLEILARESDAHTAPLMLSIRVVRLRKS
jgi:hypothetical protein